ncbi:MAG TPA: xanthine dehydrogenase family protein molybdopterin-binding subunit [Nocardioidaceae bacterium]|nr:xanthine dehydrogenase family protein molybdopterin-binding subunit [Nocardioidaceae bacterium]
MGTSPRSRPDRPDFAMPDAVSRVRGTVEFVLDKTVENMAHAKVLRSPHPHARIVSVDTTAAAERPGVLAVLTGSDLADDPDVDPYFGAQRPDQPVLAIGKTRYAGEPVALVVATTARAAAEALVEIDVEYEEQPYVVDEVEARKPGAPTVHEDHPGNDCGSWRLRLGDCEKGLAQAHRVYTHTYHSPPASHVPMEPHVCLASWTDDGVEVWTSAQAPYAVKTGLQKMFSLPDGGVRVRALNLGGAYGAKGQIRIEPMVVCASRAAGVPVRLELARDEVFFTIGKHAATVEITTGVMRDGSIVARKMNVVYNAGAYAVTSPGGAGQGLTRAPGPYRIPNVAVDSVASYTNTVPTGPFRGAMTSQLAFAYESQLDDIAADLGLEPLGIRRQNLLRSGDVYATGEALEGLHYDDLLDDLESALAVDEPATVPDPGKKRGSGLAIIIKNTLTPSRSEAGIRLDASGRISILSSSVEMGQGATATMMSLAAGYLGVGTDKVQMGLPDTRHTPFDTTTSSSRSTYSMGFALREAATDLHRRVREEAAKLWDVTSDQVTVEGGCVRVNGGAQAEVSWEHVLGQAGLEEVVGQGVFQSDFGLSKMDPHDVHGPVSVHWHQGGAAAEVEVDLQTGRVEVLRLHANCYAGRAVSAHRVRQQNLGCAIFGLGPSLFEELEYLDGAITNPNLSDYMIPSILDVPVAMTSTAVESSEADPELHGVGEMALPAVAPAIANAIFAATGVRLLDLPLTPERVLRGLLAAETTTEPEEHSDEH